MPLVGDGFAAVEFEGITLLLGAEEGADDHEVGGANVAAKVREQAEEKAGGAVEEDDFRAEVEVWVLGSGLLVPHAHEVDHLREAKVALSSSEHHFKESAVKGEVVGLL